MAALSGGGQVSFEIETSLIACSNAISQNSSGGITHGAQRLLVLLNNPYVDPNGVQEVTNGANNSLGGVSGYGSAIASYTNSFSDAIDAGQFTTMTLNYIGNKRYDYVNGVLFGVMTKLNTVLLPFDEFLLSRYPNGTQNLNAGHIRNLQVSNRPATFAISRHHAHAGVIGDSYSNSTDLIQAGSYNLGKAPSLRKVLNASGWDVGKWTATGAFGGRKVIGTNGTWNTGDAAASYLAPNMASVLANRMSTLIFQAGANDLTESISMSQSAFQTSIQGFIEQSFGLNGNAATDTKKIILCTTPWAPEYPTVAQALLRQPDITKIRNALFAIPAWMTATYPSRARDVSICDVFTSMGGFQSDPTYWTVGDLLHPGPRGEFTMGTAWGRSLLNFVNI